MSEASTDRVKSSVNMVWTPRPGWASVRLVGTCADRSLRRGQVVEHAPGHEYDVISGVGGGGGLVAGASIIVLSEAALLVEDDFHLVPENAIVAVGEQLP